MSRPALTIAKQGVCWGCGCTEAQACRDFDDEAGYRSTCYWVSPDCTLCNVCALRYAAALFRTRAPFVRVLHLEAA